VSGELVVLVRICGSTFSVVRKGERLVFKRRSKVDVRRVPDQTATLKLLRKP
jgi:hypothetical protein